MLSCGHKYVTRSSRAASARAGDRLLYSRVQNNHILVLLGSGGQVRHFSPPPFDDSSKPNETFLFSSFLAPQEPIEFQTKKTLPFNAHQFFRVV